MRTRLGIAAAAAATFTLLASAACGNSASPGEEPAQASVKVGLVPVTAVAPIYLGQEKGIFEKHGLKLEIVKGIGGPSAVAAIQSGNVDVAIAAPDTMLQTASKGLTYKSMASAGSVGPDGVGGSQVVVKAGSNVKSAADLNGKKVGVFILRGANELNVRAAIDAKGGDSSTVKFVNLEFAAMLAALERGEIDAAGLAEPILSQALAAKKVEVVLDYYPIVFPQGANITLWFTGNKQLESKGKTLGKFRAALAEASKYADEHPDEVRKLLPQFSGISPEVAASVPLQKYSMPLSKDTFQRTADLMQKYGTLDEAFTMNFDELVMS